MRRLSALLLALAVAPGAAAAPAHWTSAAPSSLDWTAKWQGTPVKGSFPDFTVKASFDPQAPAGGTVMVGIDATAVRSASGDVTHAIHGPQWFDTGHHPRASFHGRFSGKPGNLHLAGTLQLKGHHAKVQMPVKLARQGDGSVLLTGSVALQRGDFGIGTGKWSSSSMIAPDVDVTFSVTLQKRD